MGQRRIYLDNAATTWPKPECVYEAVDHYQRSLGAPGGRGAYHSAVQSAQIVDRARGHIRRLVNATHDAQVIFGFNATDLLNLAIHGLLRPGDHVVLTDVDHNSVLRPVATLVDAGVVTASYVTPQADGVFTADEVLQAIEPKTRLVILPHASNVTGAIQPVEVVATRLAAADRSIPLLVDAAQTLGHVAIDLQQTPIDLLVSSGHKGLLGPLGTGVMVMPPKMVGQIAAARQGGTGNSESTLQPTTAPEKFEAGSPNMPGLAGLAASVEYLLEHQNRIRAHERMLIEQLLSGLSEIEQATVYGPQVAQRHVGVVSFTLDGCDPHEVAMMLDGSYGLEIRAGLQCAPRMHRVLGTDQRGGTLRASVGPFNTEEEIDQLVSAIAEFASICS